MIERCENFERYPVQTLEGWCHATHEPIHCGGQYPLCRHLECFFPVSEYLLGGGDIFEISDEEFARMEEEYEESCRRLGEQDDRQSG